MKKSFLLLLFIICLVTVVQARHKKIVKQGTPIAITMHRTACFGRCPDYEVKLEKSGIVTYTGYMFAKDSGINTKNAGAAAIKKVLDLCARYRVDTCKDVYDNMVPDLPGLYLVIPYKSMTKKIVNASFGPGFLREIANNVDALGRVDSTWKHVGPVPKR